MIFSGAGISADSGVQTFRDHGGLWENHSVDEVCRHDSMRRNPEKTMAFYNARRVELGTVQPNDAHHMVRRMQQKYGAQIITQNVDDLFERAGCTDVVHVHGFLTRMRCVACGHKFDIGHTAWDYPNEQCPNTARGCVCKKGIRPDVVFFNEPAPEYMRMYAALKLLDLKKGVLVVIGTSGQVIDIGGMAVGLSGHTILSNLESATTQSMPGESVCEDRQFKEVLHGRASIMAPAIEAAIDRAMA